MPDQKNRQDTRQNRQDARQSRQDARQSRQDARQGRQSRQDARQARQNRQDARPEGTTPASGQPGGGRTARPAARRPGAARGTARGEGGGTRPGRPAARTKDERETGPPGKARDRGQDQDQGREQAQDRDRDRDRDREDAAEIAGPHTGDTAQKVAMDARAAGGEAEPDAARRRRRAQFLRELNEAKALRDRVQPRRARAARMRQAMRMRTFRW